MTSVANGWCSELLNDVHNDFSQSSRNDAFCSGQVADELAWVIGQ
jgi:hypothetical protein